MNHVKTLDETIDFIKSERFETLTENELIDIIPSFGLNNEVIEEQPIQLASFFGKGIKMWQYPIQIAPFLIWLKSVKIKSYLEIGARWGGNFIVISEVLKRKNSSIKLFACDLIPTSDILIEYQKYSLFSYLLMDSKSDEFKSFIEKNSVEMVYIDGDHSYNGCWSDYLLFKDNATTKYIVFHDIDNSSCPDIAKIWNEIKNDSQFKFIEFKNQYPKEDIPWQKNYLGIGVLIKKEISK